MSNANDKRHETMIQHHLSSFLENNLDAVVADYTSESVLITRDQTYRGPGEIRGFFAVLMKHFPTKVSDFQLERLVVENGLAYIVWQASTPSVDVSLGTDTFVLKEGKIYHQTFAGAMRFK